jgi:hypothetical protein
MRALRIILYNLNIILAGMFITFQILDLYNPTMNFIGNSITVYMLFAFCILSIINSCILLAQSRKRI